MDDLFWMVVWASPVAAVVGVVLFGLAVRALGRSCMRLRPARIGLFLVLFIAAVLLFAFVLFVAILPSLPVGLWLVLIALGLSGLLTGLVVYGAARRGVVPRWLY